MVALRRLAGVRRANLILAYLDKVDGVWTGQLHAAAEAAPGTPIHNRTVEHKCRGLDWVLGLAASAGATSSGATGSGAIARS